MKSTNTQYGTIARGLHWIAALFILLLAPMGMIMIRMGDHPLRATLYQAHGFIGMLVAILTLGRVVWRFIEPTPAKPDGLTGNKLLLFRVVHFSLYVLLFIMALTGMGMVIASGIPFGGTITPAAINSELPQAVGHSAMSKVFMGLFFAHLVGVFQYQLGIGDVFSRIGLGWLKFGKHS